MNLLLYFIQVNVSGHYQIASDIDKVEYKGNIKRRTIFLSSANYPLELLIPKERIGTIGVYFRSPLFANF